jgi:hypothetical protein
MEEYINKIVYHYIDMEHKSFVTNNKVESKFPFEVTVSMFPQIQGYENILVKSEMTHIKRGYTNPYTFKYIYVDNPSIEE